MGARDMFIRSAHRFGPYQWYLRSVDPPRVHFLAQKTRIHNALCQVALSGRSSHSQA